MEERCVPSSGCSYLWLVHWKTPHDFQNYTPFVHTASTASSTTSDSPHASIPGLKLSVHAPFQGTFRAVKPNPPRPFSLPPAPLRAKWRLRASPPVAMATGRGRGVAPPRDPAFSRPRRPWTSPLPVGAWHRPAHPGGAALIGRRVGEGRGLRRAGAVGGRRNPERRRRRRRRRRASGSGWCARQDGEGGARGAPSAAPGASVRDGRVRPGGARPAGIRHS